MNPCGSESSSGTILLREVDATPGTYLAISGVEEMPQYNATAETAECGGFDASASGYKSKYKTGIRDQDDMSAVFSFKSGDAQQMLLRQDFESDDAQNYRIQLPDTQATKLDLAINMISWGLPIPTAGENIQRSVTMQPTGDPTWSEA